MNAKIARAFALPPQSGARGAAMGRCDFGPCDPDDAAHWYCAQIRLDSQGYESGSRGNATYWGVRDMRTRLYYVTDGESFARYIDAHDRKHAIAIAREEA